MIRFMLRHDTEISIAKIVETGAIGRALRIVTARTLVLLIALALGGVAISHAQPIDLDPDAAEETLVDQQNGTEEVPAEQLQELVDDLPANTSVPTARNAQPAGQQATTVQKTESQRGKRVVAASKKAARPSVLIIRSIVTSPSSYLTDADIEEAKAALSGRRLRPSEFGEITNVFNSQYSREQIALAQAVIEAVDYSTGTVVVRLIEARIGEVLPQGKIATNDYYRRRIGVQGGDLADNRIIERKIRRIWATDGVAADASFEPGAAPGTTNLVVNFAEPPKHSFVVTADNYGTKATGEARISAVARDASLTGVLDSLVISGVFSKGSASGTISYARPITLDGTRLFGSATVEYTATIDGTDVISNTQTYEGGVSHALLVEPNYRVLGRASGSYFHKDSSVVGVTTQHQTGYAIVGGVTFVYEQPGLVFSYDQIVRLAIWDDDVLVRTGLGTTYLAGTATVVKQLMPRLSGSVRGSWQVAFGDEAPSTFATTIASPEVVRGYPTGLSAGDSFFWVRSQIETSHAIDGPVPVVLTPYAFFDIGQAFDLAGGMTTSQDLLSSTGAGIRLAFGAWGEGEVFFSKPLLNANGYIAANNFRVDGRFSIRF